MAAVGRVMAPAAAQSAFTFAPYVGYDAGSGSSGIDAHDLDGDCDIDLSVANRDTNDVTILLNNGDGTFAPGVSYTVGTTPRYVFGADFDADGDIDLVTPDWDGHTVSILTNRGNGIFDLTTQFSLYRPAWLIVFDVDNDLDPDILVTKWDINAPGPNNSPAIVTILYNDGSGSFTEVEQGFINPRPRGGAVADLNHDGWTDIVITHLDLMTISVLFNTGGTFDQPPVVLPAGTSPRYAAAEDLDNDSDIDVAVVNKDSDDLWIYRNDGDGNLSIAESDKYAVEPFPHSIACADFDRDGDPDLVVSNVGTGLMDVLANDGTGVFTTQKIVSPGGAAHVVAADLQHDGMTDIAAASIGLGEADVHLNVTSPVLGPSDLDRSGSVDVVDLLMLLTGWGDCPIDGACPADLNGDCAVNVVDLLDMLAGWG